MKADYRTQRVLSTGPVELTIRTRVPSKWRFVDLETGDVWKANPDRPGAFTRADDTTYVLIVKDEVKGEQQ
jgi:hypothetical protein